MGTFLALSAVIGKNKHEVMESLANYATSVGGGLLAADNMNPEASNCCIIHEENGNTTVYYPDDYLEWDDSSAFLSRELNAAVFSFHIHDSDLWMYVLYHKGQAADRFNPIPDYWEEQLSGEDIQSWKGNAKMIADLIPYISKSDIDRYLVRWNPDEEEPSKAYPSDEFGREDWQLMDFMAKLKLPFPIESNGNPKGQAYKLWTSRLPMDTQQIQGDSSKQNTKSAKPWWKFW